MGVYGEKEQYDEIHDALFPCLNGATLDKKECVFPKWIIL